MSYKRVFLHLIELLDEEEEQLLFRQLYIMVQRHITKERR